MHSQSECSGRGVCERASGICSCFTGYEGSACERFACPNGCSGHGKCRKLSELPEVQRAGYASWEVNRMQVCQCDGGYTGADCSERVCPTGDDPETTCWQNTVLGVSAIQRQVQTLSVSFVDPTGTAAVDLGTDELALIYQGYGGNNFTTPRIENVWDAATAAGAIARALKALPEYAVTAVDGELEVPAGIMAAIEMGCAEAGIEVMTLWARVPHYVASMPYPIASAALIDAVAAVAGLTVSSAELRAKAEETRQRVDDLVENNPDHESMVHNLESQADDVEPPAEVDIPSGDELAEELERFLRDQQN
jgi:hypothetical protein